MIKRSISGNIILLLISVWLLTIAFVIDNYWSTGSSLLSVQNEINDYIKQQEADFVSASIDSSRISRIQNNDLSDEMLDYYQQKKYFFFVYQKSSAGSDSLLFWNSSTIKVAPFMLYQTDPHGFLKLQNGYYVWRRLDREDCKMLMLLPVQWQYGFSNEYLTNDFVIPGVNSQQYEIVGDRNQAVSIGIDGKHLFYIKNKSVTQFRSNHPVALLLYLLALMFFLFWLHQVSVGLIRKKGLIVGFSFFIISLIIIRFAGVELNFPVAFDLYDSFNPSMTHFGSYGHSIGDLFINVAFFLWVMTFLRTRLLSLVELRTPLKNLYKICLYFLTSFLLLFAAFFSSDIIRTLISHPLISFEVFNFFSLDSLSVLGFLTIALIAMSLFFVCQNLVILHKKLQLGKFTPVWLIFTFFGLLAFTIDGGNHFSNYHLYVFLWTLLLMLFFPTRFFDIISPATGPSRALFWLMFFSISISGILLQENRKKEINAREKYAEALSIKSDESNEVLVNTMLSDFKSEFIRLHFDRFKEPFSGIALKDSILNNNATAYANSFDTRVYVFDANRKPLYNEDSISFSQLNAILSTQAKHTRTEGLYYYDQSYDVFSYLFEREINDTSGKLNGYLFILSTPKKQRREAIYPELFTKGRNKAIENNKDYAIAVYHNGNIVKTINEYPFPSKIQLAFSNNEPFELKMKNGFQELWHLGNSNVVVAIVKKDTFFLQFITSFSYIFTSLLLLSFILWLLERLDGLSIRKTSLKNYFNFSIRNRIHGTIIFISVLSFAVIGIATILFFYEKYESNNKDKLTRVIHIMEKEVDEIVDKGWLFKDSLSSLDLSIRDKELEFAIKKIGDIHGVDANMYDMEGNLIVASLNLPYSEGIMSTRINPLAYHHLARLREIQFIQRERIGNLEYTSIYIPVTDKNGNLTAFLNIPYFTSQNDLKQEISNFLIAIINLNAFIFLIAGIISFFITSGITATFALIRDKMKAINLKSNNEPITWDRDDEIGALVQEYNKMVLKLEDSARAMAAAEREGAWKEMAQQVAHEIKNPLTPMKLSMQYLQKALDNNADNIKELTGNVVKTLIEQIDHLSNIANAFSQFARIEEARKEIINLNEVVSSVCTLHQANEKLHLHLKLLDEPVEILADKTQMNRLFTNLVINAIQAVSEGNHPEITVTQKKEGKFIITRVKDNGEGIPAAMKEKIFTPNFTTKTSGTGLGLAMCKRMVEQTEGEIWFESESGVGTSFFVKLPLYQA